MPLNDLFQLDATSATSNSNYASANIAENCAPSGINNALRALGSMVARAVNYRSPDISASVSTNIAAASTGIYMAILGSGAINSFGVVPGEQPSAAVVRFLRYDSSASVSHSDSKITLLGGASRKMQPGDMQGLIHEGTADGWREFLFSRADGSQITPSISVTTLTAGSISTSAISTVTLNAASASITTIGITALSSLNSVSASVGEFTLLKAGGLSPIIFHGRATNAAYGNTTTVIPNDDTIPQFSEGLNALSLTVTPTNAASILLIDVELNLGAGSPGAVSAAVFENSSSNAMSAAQIGIANASTMVALTFSHSVTASSTAQRIYRVHYGPEAGAVTAYLNGDASARTFAGLAVSKLTVTEILP